MPRLSILKATANHHRNSSGFTLIEVLVTIVVVSIGLLGLAGLQINGLRANMSSEARSKATLLANDIVERMRANPLGVEAGAYSGITVDAASCAAPAKLCGNTSTSTAVSCTAGEMAAFDVWVWGCGTAATGVQGGGVTNQLPSGTARVDCADSITTDTLLCTPGSINTITVSWNELNPSATSTATAGAGITQSIRLNVAP
jgi:type IV pilus assembly protein PilV